MGHKAGRDGFSPPCRLPPSLPACLLSWGICLLLPCPGAHTSGSLASQSFGLRPESQHLLCWVSSYQMQTVRCSLHYAVNQF